MIALKNRLKYLKDGFPLTFLGKVRELVLSGLELGMGLDHEVDLGALGTGVEYLGPFQLDLVVRYANGFRRTVERIRARLPAKSILLG